MAAERALWPGGGGEMDRRIRLRDWRATPLGALEGWPNGLRTAVTIMLDSPHPAALTWGPEMIFLYNDACAALLGHEKHPHVLGLPAALAWPESDGLLSGERPPAVNGGGRSCWENRMIPIRRNRTPEEAWWTCCRSVIHDARVPGGIGGTLTLLTESNRPVPDQRDSEERLQIGLAAAELGPWNWDAASDRLDMSAQAAAIFGIEPSPDLTWQKLQALLHPEDAPHADAAVKRALATGEDYAIEYRVHRPDGAHVWVAARGRPVYGKSGLPPGLIGVVQDITERKRSEEKIRLLMAEVNHRSKNLLAVVQSIAHQTSARGSPRSFAHRFGERLQGLAASHDLLVGNAWQGVDLLDLVASQLSHFRDLVRQRIHFGGPHLQLRPAAAQALGMALHELATNAGKYGSLSNEQGRVAIGWRIAEGSGDQCFHMEWRETGGPPVAEPLTSGFGTKLISHMTEIALQGRAKLDYRAAGVAWSIEAPLGSITSTPDDAGPWQPRKDPYPA